MVKGVKNQIKELKIIKDENFGLLKINDDKNLLFPLILDRADILF